MMDPFPTHGRGDLLDRLLDAAPLRRPGPWFVTQSMARCLDGRDEEATPAFHWTALFGRWALAGVCTLFIAGLGLQQAHRKHTLETHRQQRVQEAFEVMASIGDDADVAPQDNSF